MRSLVAAVLFLIALSAGAQQTYVLPTAIPMTYTNGGGGGPTPPSPASAASFNTLTFQTTTFSSTNVDDTDACFANNAPGTPCASKQWFPYHNSGANPATGNGAGGSCLPNITYSSGVLVLLGCTTGPNGELGTAVALNGGNDWAGTGFGCGGYFEWTIDAMSDALASGNNACTSSSSSCSGGWQALWYQPIEFSYKYAAAVAYSWPGQASNYRLSLENDQMELTAQGSQPYGSALHLLYGVSSTTCSGSNCASTGGPSRGVTAGFVSTNQYRWGMLWVPATASTRGSLVYYRNEVPQSTVTQTWDQFTGQSPSSLPQGSSSAFNTTCTANAGTTSGFTCILPHTGSDKGYPNPTWLYGVHDNLHYVPIIGTGTGNQMNGGSNPPPVLKASKFNVWQGTGACNLSR